MFGYIFVIGCITVLYMLCHGNNDKNRRTFLLGTAIIMTLFYGLRASYVGSDTISYITMFIKDGSQPIQKLWKYMWEQKSPAYVLAEWIFYKILPFPQLWLLATSAFFFFIFSKFVEKNSIDPFFSYLIFFTIFGTFQMTGIRQSCAMAVLMLAYEQMKNKKIVKYLLLVGLAYLFHKSAIVFLPFYLLAKRRITKLDIPVTTIILVFVYRNRAFLFDYIKAFTSYDYFEQLNHGEPINFSIMIYGTTVLSIVLCLFLIMVKKRRFIREFCNNDEMEKVNVLPSKAIVNKNVFADGEIVLCSQYANAMLFASLFMPLVAINGAVRRIVMYFALFMVLLIPKAFDKLFEPQLRTVLKLLLGIVLMYLLLSGVNGSSYSYDIFF